MACKDCFHCSELAEVNKARMAFHGLVQSRDDEIIRLQKELLKAAQPHSHWWKRRAALKGGGAK